LPSFSKVLSVRILKDKESNKPKGFCYVEFVHLDALMEGLKLNGEVISPRMNPTRERRARPWRMGHCRRGWGKFGRY
jgi:RNA recognition motif-containing protein